MTSWFTCLANILVAVHGAGPSVAGSVRDGDTGAPIAGAVVTLLDLGRSTVTDADGRYLVPEVPAGTQHVEVRRAGYAPRILQALVPLEGTLEIDVILRAEPVILPGIVVRAGLVVPGLEGQDSTMVSDRVLSLAAVRGHPLLSEPDVLQAAGGIEVSLNPESPNGVHILGGATDQVAYLLDGIPILSPYHSGGTFSAWNPDALSHLELVTSSSSPGSPDALSGVVAARTRTPGPGQRSQGSMSTTQARLTLDGPVGRSGAGYLLSLRSAFPGLLVHGDGPDYLRGEGGDWLAKVESPLLGGRLSALGFGSGNEVSTNARVSGGLTPGTPRPQNQFTWSSRSFGGEWTRRFQVGLLSIRAWSAAGDAGATWRARDSSPELLVSTRRDAGTAARLRLDDRVSSTTIGIRAELSRTSYGLRPVSGAGRLVDFQVQTPVLGAFVEHRRAVRRTTEVTVSLSVVAAAGRPYIGPAVRVRWKPAASLSLSGSYVRRHQFAQSLRNTESVVGNVYPVDLHVGAGVEGEGVPIARSNLGTVALEYRPARRIRLGGRAWIRDFTGLALVAPRDADPFATSGYRRGSGHASGAGIDAAASGQGYGIMASYSFQRVRLAYGDTSYVPDYGAPHTIRAGVAVLPTANSTIRIGLTSVLGRRTTAVIGPFEWEACNLRDRGCEVAGSPGGRSEPLGGTALPGYLRLDIGLRQQWSLRLAGRSGILAVFGTLSNLLDRKNVLTVVIDPATGRRQPIHMLPRSLLVVGMDWSY